MIDFRRLGLPEARDRIAGMPGNPKWDTSDGLYGVDDLIGGGVAYMVTDEGGPLMLLVIEQVQHEQGRELVVRAARQYAAAGDLTERVLPEVERVFGHGCDAVTIYTRRAGLVRKLEAAGYGEAGTIMRKMKR